MQKWEYEFARISHPALPNTLTDLNTWKSSLLELGQDGWELVSVDNGIAYFKRPLKAEAAITDLVKCFDPREGESVGPYPHVSQGVYGD